MHPHVQHPGLAKFQAHKAQRRVQAIARSIHQSRLEPIVAEIRAHNPDMPETRARTIAESTLRLRVMCR